MEEPVKAVNNRMPNGTFGAGNNANPAGRPKGKTLKEYQAEKFRTMSDEEKEQWLIDNKVAGDTRWRMAEGNPRQESDFTSDGKPIIMPAILINKNDSNPDAGNSSGGHA